MPTAISLIGGRPNLLKAAVVDAALRGAGWQHSIVDAGCLGSTGGDELYRDFSLRSLVIHVVARPADANYFGTISQTSRDIARLCQERRPSAMIVYGDLSPSVGGVLGGVAAGISTVHVEAGLRSRDLEDIEEINRLLIDGRSTFLLCNSEAAIEALRSERIPSERCFLTGNTVTAALGIAASHLPGLPRSTRDSNYAFMSFHRDETLASKERCENIVAAIELISSDLPATIILYNRTERALQKHGLLRRLQHIRQLTIVPTQLFGPYFELLRSASVVVTDSSGTLDEARALGKAVVILRRTTHRVHAVDSRHTALAGFDPSAIHDACQRLLATKEAPGPIDALTAVSADVVRRLTEFFQSMGRGDT